MHRIDRRSVLRTGAAALIPTRLRPASTSPIDEALRSGIERRKIPCAVAMVAGPDRTLYAGAFGVRDTSRVPARIDSIFQIASMTKAITTVAALQLVEQGRVGLDDPVAKYLPEFENIQVLGGYDSGGNPVLRPPATPPTLRHLVTHTSGLCYDYWDGDKFRYVSKHKPKPGMPGPLMFDPGKRWQYGQGLDWTGSLIEALTKMTLEEYFQAKILKPLKMDDTSYILPASKFDRAVSVYGRASAGAELKQEERKPPSPPKSFNGGGGLYSTAADYVRFMQMILNGGAGPNGVRILRKETVDEMKKNQIGSATASKMKSYRPAWSSDVDVQPGHDEKWTLAFLMNTDPYDGGRSAGSLAWAGLLNTFYWIDPKRNLCAVILMQFLPFVDKEAVGLLNDFERAVYAAKLT